jgi:hypothetical protein
MHPADDLKSLAADIKKNGLFFPIVIRKVDGEDELIDGRNRMEACKIAGIKPTFNVFDGDEEKVIAFITSANLHRRDLKKTQKAALFAMTYPEPPRLKRKGVIAGDNNNEIIRDSEAEIISDDFYPHQLSKCRTVLRYSESLLDDIVNDRVPLETAFSEAKEAEARSLASVYAAVLVVGCAGECLAYLFGANAVIHAQMRQSPFKLTKEVG